MTEPLTVNELARENYNRFLRGRDAGHKAFVDDATRFDAFYQGDQWAAADVKALELSGRPATTTNFVLPTVNAMVGELTHMQADIQYKPARGGATAAASHVASRLAMHIAATNQLEAREKEMIEDGLITGRGYLDVRIDFDDNVLGEVRITNLDCKEVILDPTAREYDPSTWNEVITTRWLSLDEIAAVYGVEAAERLSFFNSSGGLFLDDSIRWEERSSYGTEVAFRVGALDDIETGRTIREVRVIERQYYKLAKVREFVDPVNGDIRPVPEKWSAERVQLYVEAKNLEMRTRLTRRIRWTTSADCVLLRDSWSPYLTFSVLPFFCYFRRGKPFGAVKNIVSPQETFNKVTSQVLHVVNTTANSGWIVDAGALANMTLDELSSKGAETGLIIERNPGREIDKIQPNAVPSGLDRIAGTAAASIHQISGVNAAMMGLDDSESGVALQNKQQRSSIQMQTVRGNVKRTRDLLGRKILELVQLFYSEERVYFITGAEGETEELVINARDAAGQVVNDLTLGEYGVVVGSIPARDTYEEVQLSQAMEMREAGIMIPDHWMIGMSNISRKAELADMVKNLTGFGDKSPEQQQMEQLQMEMLQAQVDQLIADVEETRANAQLAMAKAASEGDKPTLEREKLNADMAITQEEQSVRLQVSRLKELSGQLKSIMALQAKTLSDQQKARTTAQQARKPHGQQAERKRA